MARGVRPGRLMRVLNLPQQLRVKRHLFSSTPSLLTYVPAGRVTDHHRLRNFLRERRSIGRTGIGPSLTNASSPTLRQIPIKRGFSLPGSELRADVHRLVRELDAAVARSRVRSEQFRSAGDSTAA